MTATRRPRHYAQDLVDAWVRGEPLPVVPEQHAQLARAHAKNLCQQIQYHAKHGTPEDKIKGSRLAVWVEVYRGHRK